MMRRADSCGYSAYYTRSACILEKACVVSFSGLSNSILALAATLGRASETRKDLFFLQRDYERKPIKLE